MAGTAKRAILIEILGDSSGYVKGAKKAGTATATFDTSLKKLGGVIASTYAAKTVVDFGVAAVKAAADDAAAQAVLANAMRNTTKATDDQIAAMEDWITKTSHATGFLDDSMRPSMAALLRVTKDQTKAQELMSLAMNVSRGTGKDLESVSTAIAKAYGGSTTALTKLVPGIKLASDGTFTFALAQERLNEQFGGAAAEYAETAQGRLERLNAQYQDMKETIGEALMPVMEQLVGVVAAVFGWFSKLDPATQQTIVIMGLVAGAVFVGVTAFNALAVAVSALGVTAAATVPWLVAIGTVAAVAIAAVQYFTDDSDEAAEATRKLNDSVRTAAGGLDIQRLAFLDAADAAELYNGVVYAASNKEARDKIVNDRQMVEAMQYYGYSMEEVLAATHDLNAAEKMRRTFLTGDYGRKYNAANEDQREGMRKLFEMMVEMGTAGSEVVALNVELAKTGDLQAISFLKASENMGLLNWMERAAAEAVLDRAAATKAAAQETGTLVDASTDLVSAQLPLISSTEQARRELSEAATAASEFKAAIDAVLAPAMNFEDANRAVIAGVQELTDNFSRVDEEGRKLSATLDINSARGRENREVVQGQVKSIFDFGVAMVGAGYSTEDAAANVELMTSNLKDQLKMLGLNDEEANAYIESLGLTPENVTTVIALANADATKTELTGLLEQLEGMEEGAKASITADIDAGNFEKARSDIKAFARANGIPLRVSVFGGGTIAVTPRSTGKGLKVSAYKKGGHPVAGETALVGEDGPELVTFGHDSTVHTSGATDRILSGGGRGGRGTVNYFVTEVHVAGSVIRESELGEILSEQSRRQNRDVTVRTRVPV